MGRFIHLILKLFTPLQALAHANVFIWEDEHQKCYEEVKQVLKSLPTIAPPKWNQEFFINPYGGENKVCCPNAKGRAIMLHEIDSFYKLGNDNR